MLSDPRRAALRALALAPYALALSLTVSSVAQLGCVDAGVVLERVVVDGSIAEDGGTDADGEMDAGPDAGPDAQEDGGPTGNVTIYLTGFDAYAGMTIYARLGALSGVVVSATIQPDGTAVMILNQIFTILSSTYFESYVDVDGSGSCSSGADHLAASNVFLTRNGDDYTVTLDESDTSAPLLGCLVLN
ncbi:MAG: hypothetical protein KC593_19595 [Myxococcales bacterium]|nr:hypothetical protein [Myxococcales bacterium]MCA9574687.1 hypothetical protein [Myxococcales bacterium]